MGLQVYPNDLKNGMRIRLPSWERHYTVDRVTRSGPWFNVYFKEPEKAMSQVSEGLPFMLADAGFDFSSLSTPPSDPVNHPTHYTSHPSGVECITITEHMNFNVGNAMKYLWRAGLKADQIEDLKKAAFYIDREIKRIGGEKP